jgi:hypothetical protein
MNSDVAYSLKELLMSLAENAGMDRIDTTTELREKQNTGDKRAYQKRTKQSQIPIPYWSDYVYSLTFSSGGYRESLYQSM